MNDVERERRRDLEVAQSNIRIENFWSGITSSPYFYIGMSPVVGVFVYRAFAVISPMSNVGLVLSLVLALTLFIRGMLMIDRRPSSAKRSRKITAPPSVDAEKQLLLALKSHGSLTPVGAALATALTVDESDRILSRLADRGHLRIEVRDGFLSYSIPASETEGSTVV